MRACCVLVGLLCVNALSWGQITVDHACTNIAAVPFNWVNAAKSNLHIAYGHTSHGSQLTTGMDGLVDFMNLNGYPENLYAWNDGGAGGALDLADYAMAGDLGSGGDLTWAEETRNYLDEPGNSDVNVIIWSWCGGMSVNTDADVDAYLNEMNKLEQEYPGVRFVYMTGHRDIWSDATLKHNNQRVRDYCQTHGKTLYDFADIESYNPDGVYFAYATDSCDYYDAHTNLLGNWAQEWQNSHTENLDWYNCESAHSEPLNANRKAYAAWWLWARLAGWDGSPSNEGEVEGEGEVLPEGEGEVLPEGEGEVLPEGEGEVLPEGEGEVLPEGEGEVLPEGEGEHENCFDQMGGSLLNNFSIVDGDGNGAVSLVEAAAAYPQVTESDFDAVDSDGNGQLSLEELADYLGVPLPDDGAGCQCFKSKKMSFQDLRRVWGDWMLLAISVMTLTALHRRKTPWL